MVQLFVQYAPYDVNPKVGSWADPGFKEGFVQRCLSVVDEFAPGFSGSVLGVDALSPLDLERVFGLHKVRARCRRSQELCAGVVPFSQREEVVVVGAQRLSSAHPRPPTLISPPRPCCGPGALAVGADGAMQGAVVQGNIFHGALALHQLSYTRPAPGFSSYRSPVKVRRVHVIGR